MIIQSPIFIGRSHKIVMPAARLLTMFCNPNPAPKDKAPAMMARLLKLPPMTAMAKIPEIINPKKLIDDIIEFLIPSSISILLKLPSEKLFLSNLNNDKKTKKEIIPSKIDVMEIWMPPMLNPTKKL